MSASKFVPLSAELIDEGGFLADLNEELVELQAKIIKYARTHGSKAKGASACLDVKITIGIETSVDDTFHVKTTFKATHPKRPATVSLAMASEDEYGEPQLLVRVAGGNQTEPRQGRLFTNRGETIDHETGEVLED